MRKSTNILLGFIATLLFFMYPHRSMAQEERPQGGTLVAICEHTQGWTRNFNPFLQNALQTAKDYIFEPLVVYNIIGGSYIVPRLATKFSYSHDLTSITYSLRQGVQWSDGMPFDADDVVYTFELIQRFPSLDRSGINSALERVVKLDSHTVRFELKEPDSTIEWLLGEHPIVPEHQWRDIENPANFTNPNPVGVGPFTEIKEFSSSSYTQCRNPHYWDLGKPFIDCMKFPAMHGNDTILAELLKGEVDWTGIFIPDIEATYVQKNPKHFHYWFPPNDNISLYLNTTKQPTDHLAFRRALSMSLDRDNIVQIATYGYATVSKYPTGLGELYKDWYDPEVNAAVGNVGKYAPEAAQRLLDELGYQDQNGDGFRELPDGSPLTLKVGVVQGWTDWEAAVRMVTEYWQEIGIHAERESLGFQEWLEELQRGEFQVSIGWGNISQSPWRYYYNLLSKDLMKERAAGLSWPRWTSPESEDLLDAYKLTTNLEEQRRIIGKLQRLIADNVPLIPLFSNPSWYQYNDTRFVGWATADNPYVRPMCFHENRERLLHVLNLSLRPNDPSLMAPAN